MTTRSSVKCVGWCVLGVTLYALMAGISGCVASENPPDSTGVLVANDPYLGAWILIHGLGISDVSGELQIVDSADGIEVLYSSDSETKSFTGHIISLGGNDLASLSDGSEWYVAKVELEDDGSRMLIYGLNGETIASDIENNFLDGDIMEMDVNSARIVLTASPAELRDYLDVHSDSFATEPALEFERVNGQSVAPASSDNAVTGGQLLPLAGMLLAILVGGTLVYVKRRMGLS